MVGGVGVGTTLGYVATLGGVSTLGRGFTLGCDSTLVGQVCLGVESTLGGWYGTGSGVVGTGGGVSETDSGLQAPNRSHSLEIASTWLWCSVAGESLMVHESNWRYWTMRSSGVSVGCIT